MGEWRAKTALLGPRVTEMCRGAVEGDDVRLGRSMRTIAEKCGLNQGAGSRFECKVQGL